MSECVVTMDFTCQTCARSLAGDSKCQEHIASRRAPRVRIKESRVGTRIETVYELLPPPEQGPGTCPHWRDTAGRSAESVRAAIASGYYRI